MTLLPISLKKYNTTFTCCSYISSKLQISRPTESILSPFAINELFTRPSLKLPLLYTVSVALTITLSFLHHICFFLCWISPTGLVHTNLLYLQSKSESQTFLILYPPALTAHFSIPLKARLSNTVVFNLHYIIFLSTTLFNTSSHFFHSSDQFVKERSVKNRSATFYRPVLPEIFSSFGFYLFFIYLTSKNEHVQGFTSPYF